MRLFTLVGLKLDLKFESEDANFKRILILVTSAEMLNAVQYEMARCLFDESGTNVSGIEPKGNWSSLLQQEN